MIHIPEDIQKKISFLIGKSNQVSNAPVMVYDESRTQFLSDLSRELFLGDNVQWSSQEI